MIVDSAIKKTTLHNDTSHLVQLDPDHPGFRDPLYRQRRNQIAKLALSYQKGKRVPNAPYTEEEHQVWQIAWKRLTPLHMQYACNIYQECQKIFPLSTTRIPQLAEINKALFATNGFRMLPVAGLVSERVFLAYLANDVFLSTQYIRHHSMPLYTPEPDIIHELIGHASTLFHPDFAGLNRLFGNAARQADPETLSRIARVYWYTIEFGVLEEEEKLKVYGAGLLSSSGELERFASSAKLCSFDIDKMSHTPYDPTAYQDVLFVAPSFSSMVQSVSSWLKSC